MHSIATVGVLIEVSPWDDLQYYRDANTDCCFVVDRTPFRFRVAGDLIDDGFFFGLYGPIVDGPERYQKLVCNIKLRNDNSNWHNDTKCAANFCVAPTIAKRRTDFDPVENGGFPFYFHPDGTYVQGYPQISRYGEIVVVYEPQTECIEQHR